MLQTFPYQEQINAKQDRLRFELGQIAKITDVDAVLKPIIETPEPFRFAHVLLVCAVAFSD
jgi:hypothetical protein